MEYSDKHIWTKQNELKNISVDIPNDDIYKKVLKNWDSIAKPLDGMGIFECLTAQIGAILDTDNIDISKKAVVVMCADNGIVEEGISQSSQEVTAIVANEMANGASSVTKMAQFVGADVIIIDIGINQKEKIAGVINKKIRCGTRNFKIEPAMTEQEMIQAIFTGIETVSHCKQKGYTIIATGEMGIGNTTTSSAIIAALLKCKVDTVTGRGAGLCDEKLLHKIKVITEAIEKYKLMESEPLKILQTVGGFDIAALTGVCIGGALFHIPIVLDGVISMTAALLAQKIIPNTVHYFIPSHKGKEPAIKKIIKELNLQPVIDANMALGEGTGAVMMLSLLDMALCIYNKRTTFLDIDLEQYKREI